MERGGGDCWEGRRQRAGGVWEQLKQEGQDVVYRGLCWVTCACLIVWRRRTDSMEPVSNHTGVLQ